MIRSRRSSELSPADLALCVHGPWHADARCDADRPLWDPRVEERRLRALWTEHRAAIEAAAAGAEPWVLSRLAFCDLLR